MMNNRRLRKGNHKLPTSIGIFDLPYYITCPGATIACKQYCYAKKAERAYNAVLPYRMLNYNLSTTKHFVKDMVAEIHRMKFKCIRIHASGDFYSQEYLDKWCAIAEQCKDTTFYSYTKSFMLCFKKIPSNFILRMSIDDTTVAKIPSGFSLAIYIPKGGKAPKTAYICPGNCRYCNFCYRSKKGNVAFYNH